MKNNFIPVTVWRKNKYETWQLDISNLNLSDLIILRKTLVGYSDNGITNDLLLVLEVPKIHLKRVVYKLDSNLNTIEKNIDIALPFIILIILFVLCSPLSFVILFIKFICKNLQL